MGFRAKILSSIAEVSREAWNALCDEASTPFVRWEWLEALETSGCAVSRTGWLPRHLTLWRDGALVAAAPAYEKRNSDGDFSRDWSWADAASRFGTAYYPKLVIGVPFTPVTGQRLLVAAGADRIPCVTELIKCARRLMAKEALPTLQVLFPTRDALELLTGAGLHPRMDFQYHWHNPGYENTDAFLARFDSKRRNAIKRERAAPVRQGIFIRTIRGDEISNRPEHWAKLAHAFHRATVDKLMWGRRWLNEKFYIRAFAGMPQAMELVVAERAGRPIAGAFNVAGANRLFGRYWGCLEEHPFLHFSVCYYHSIDECIRRGTRAFEGGAGGEHKVARGFEPSPTYSAHQFAEPRFDSAMREYLKEEWRERSAGLENWRSESPLFKPLASTGAP